MSEKRPNKKERARIAKQVAARLRGDIECSNCKTFAPQDTVFSISVSEFYCVICFHEIFNIGDK